MSLAYRNMQHTLGMRELESSQPDARDNGQPKEEPYYWHIEHKAKRSWKFLCDFWGSEAAMAAFWSKHFGTKPNYRLICFDLTRHITQKEGEGQHGETC